MLLHVAIKSSSCILAYAWHQSDCMWLLLQLDEPRWHCCGWCLPLPAACISSTSLSGLHARAAMLQQDLRPGRAQFKDVLGVIFGPA
jgi:hypothetical protein